MGQDLSLRVVLQAQDAASGKLKGFGSTLINLAGDAGPLLSGLLAISAVVVAVGVQAVQTAAQYSQSMTMVQALTGANSQQMGYYDSQLKQLAMNAGVAPNALAQGLYNVLSAGYQGAQAMSVLTLATEDAKIGMTDAKTTTNALTVALKAFNVPASQFNAVNGEMLRTVTAGKMSMQDYASAISKTSSVAVQYNDSMSDMNAVLATLTSSGIKNANVAGTDYNNLLKVLNGNTAAVAKASHAINPAFNENAFAAMNVHDKVMYLNQMIVQHGHNISEVIGKQQNAEAAFTMLATHADTYGQNLKNLSDQQANAKATGDAWAITQDDFNQTLDRAQAAVQVLFIDIGQRLLPVLTQIVGAVAPAISWLINFAGAMSHNQLVMALLKGALVGFIALILMILVPAFITWAASAGAAALATLAATWPLLAISAAIAGLVALFLLAYQHCAPFHNIIQSLGAAFHRAWAAIQPGTPLFRDFQKILQDIGSFLAATFLPVWKQLQALWSGTLLPLFKQLWQAIAPLQPVLKVLGAILGGIIVVSLGLLIGMLMGAVKGLAGFLSGLGTLIGGIVQIFTGLVQIFTGIIHFIFDLVTGNWKNLNKDIAQIGHGIINIFSGIWNAVKGVFQAAWGFLSGFVMGMIQGIIGFFQHLWDKLVGHSIIPDTINGIISWFASLPGKVLGAIVSFIANIITQFIHFKALTSQKIGDVITAIKNFFTSLPAQALQWGKDMIQGFINGIKNMAGAIGNAVQNVGNGIKSFLHFSKPDQGPLADIDTWMPDMMDLMTQGIIAGNPKLQAAVQTTANVLAGAAPPAQPAMRATYGSIPYGQLPIMNSSSSYAGGYTHNGDIVIHAPNGSNPDAIAKAVMDQLSRKYRSSGLMGNPSRGMRDS